MPLVLGSGLDGATTVSGTMLLAARAGIKVFVTGGIGGVHRWAAGVTYTRGTVHECMVSGC
jgi:pseudouridine-5'-phosphate glycosidase